MKKTILLVGALAILPLFALGNEKEGKWEKIVSQAGYSYEVYTPKALSEKPGVVLMLHGCMGNSQQMLKQTKFTQEADRKGFYLFIPNQSNSSNPWGCWNWGVANNQTRKYGGDSEYILVNLEKTIQEKNIDRSKVFLIGFSSGAGMGMNLISCFPDIFHGALIHSGLEFAAANNANDAFRVMRTGPSRPVEETVKMALACMGPFAKEVPVIAVHGSGDTTVYPINFERIQKQVNLMNQEITKAAGNPGVMAQTEGNISGGSLTTKMVETTLDGKWIQRSYYVQGMNHAWSGGERGVQYSEPRGAPVSTLFTDAFFQ